MFADQKIDRYPLAAADGSDWKTIDDYLPMLKYGTQLPAPTKPPPVVPVISETSASPIPAPGTVQSISLVDIDLPFGSILKLMFKWMAAAFIVSLSFIPAAKRATDSEVGDFWA